MMNSNFNSMRQGSSMYSGNYGMGSNSYQRGNSMMNANGQAEGPNGPQNQGFKSEYHGVIHGLQSTLQVAYASVQFYSFSRIFVDLTKKLIQTMSNLSQRGLSSIVKRLYLDKLFNLIKRILNIGFKSSDLPIQNGKLLGGIILLTRIIAVIALLVCFKIRQSIVQKSQKERELLEKQELEPQQSQQQIEQKSEEFWNQNTQMNDYVPITQPKKESFNYLQDLVPNIEQPQASETTESAITTEIPKQPWKRSTTTKSPFVI